MSKKLKEYKRKRNLKKSSEPEGKVIKRGKYRFSIQRHNASQLHFDLRIEAGGTLKSWAIPKGPSLNPAQKRLAVMVEDHPVEYLDFEGVIEEGNYGAGSVIVWDLGNYKPAEITDKRKNHDTIFLDQLKEGKAAFILKGKRLQGEFALVHMNNDNGNNWLLIKKKDEYAKKNNILKEKTSVISGATNDDIEEEMNNDE